LGKKFRMNFFCLRIIQPLSIKYLDSFWDSKKVGDRLLTGLDIALWAIYYEYR